MGCTCTRGFDSQPNQYRRQMFIYKEMIGLGACTKVWKVKIKTNKSYYALKIIDKDKIIANKMINNVMNERQLMGKLYHPFLVDMIGAFQDRQYLYLLMQYVQNGDLRNYMKYKSTISEKEVSINFFIQNLQFDVYYNIVHRDIKPENILIDKNGYCKLCDLGIAKKQTIQYTKQTTGTIGYMSPEVLFNHTSSYWSDYYSIGVVAYELLTGYRPYKGLNKRQIKQNILSKEMTLSNNIGLTQQCINFVNNLIKRKPMERLGYKGIQQILKHPWIYLSPQDRQQLRLKKMVSPIKTPIFQYKKDNEDKNFTPLEVKQARLLLRDQKVQSLFKNYDYTHEQFIHKDKVILLPTNHFTGAQELHGNGNRSVRNNTQINIQ